MVQTFSDNKNIYSVDMMFAYINIFKPKHKDILVNSLLHTLEYKGWGEPTKNIYYSPMEVIKNPKNNKYKKEIERINKANLSYPIIIYNNYIIDGVHRLSKAYLDNKKKIKAYIFTKQEMDKFLIDKKLDWNKVDKLQIYDFIKLFYEQFCE